MSDFGSLGGRMIWADAMSAQPVIRLGDPGFEQFARDAAARAGNLDHLLTNTQLEAHDAWERTPGMGTFLADCSRRFGKTTLAAVIAREARERARRQGRSAIIRYCAPSKLMGRTFVMPAFAWVDERVPADLRPKFDRQDTCWRWPDGTVCYLGSAETMADLEAQVGTECDLAIADEPGKWPMGHLTHWIKSVILPQFATREWGRIFVGSTPPLTPAHDLSEVRRVAVETGNYVRYTIDALDHVSPTAKAKLIEEIRRTEGGETAVLRELYCEYVTDETMAIIPEMREAKAWISEDIPARPQFFDAYVVADFGFSDLTVVLFAWYDFPTARLIIEDELVFRGKSGIEVARGVMRKRHELWGIDKQPAAQMADAVPQVIADMAEATRHDTIGGMRAVCTFGSVEKTDADAALNTARSMISERRVRIHPRCTVLLDHLANGVWATGAKSTFARSDLYGHFDGIDAFKYLVRHVNWRRNPVPMHHGADPQTHHIPPVPASASRTSLADMVRRKRR